MFGKRIGVWWDINTCPVPKWIDFRSVRSRIEHGLRRRCGYSPIVIFCVGDLERIDTRVLEGLSSSGIMLRHVPPFGWSVLCDLLEDWKKCNLPMACILLISGDISWFTGSWFNSSILSLRLNILRAFPAPRPPGYPSSIEWVWESLLLEPPKNSETNSQIIPLEDEHSLFCTLCQLPCESCDSFINHLNSDKHKDELACSVCVVVDENNEFLHSESLVDKDQCATTCTSLGLSYNISCLSNSEFCRKCHLIETTPPRVFSKKIGVWWDINTCPIPDGCDPRRVRFHIESALHAYIGHACPVTIFCIGNLEFISPNILKEISTSGIHLRHTILRGATVRDLLLFQWSICTPPPAKIMLVSADQTWFGTRFYSLGYTVLRALPHPQSFPSCSFTHAWAWESLLDEKSCLDSYIQLLPEDTNTSLCMDEPVSWFCNVCRTPSQSCDGFITHLKSTSHSQQLWMWVDDSTSFLCKLCNYPGYDLHNFEIHLSSEEHAQKVNQAKANKKRMDLGAKATREDHVYCAHIFKTPVEANKKRMDRLTKANEKRMDSVAKANKKRMDRVTKANKRMESACLW